MHFKNVLKEVEESKEFKSWKEKNKKSFLAAMFLTLDFEKMKDNKPRLDQKQVDYASGKKIAIFHIAEEKGEKKIIVTEENQEQRAVKESKLVGKKVKPRKLEKIKFPKEIKVDIADFESQVRDEMSEKKMQNLKITKIIAVLQMHDNKLIWNLTTIFTSFEILTMHVDIESGKLFYSDKKNLFQCMKTIHKGKQEDKQKEESKDKK
jgi:hypothetical protein